MLTFLKLWELMQSQDDSPLNSSGESSNAMHAIRAGMNLQGENSNRSFWDDFLKLCNNTEGMSELLDVRPDQIAKWTTKIRNMVQQVENDDRNDIDKKQVLPTGDGSFDNTNQPVKPF
jgi:hypothetical protein